MLPSPTHRFINWFYEEDKKRTLVLQPKYQRNPVWSESQRCFLIDSILNDIPIGQIYLNVVTRGSGIHRKTTYEVVDGQQRLGTILDFMHDKFQLKAVRERTYPVSDTYERLIGKKYSELASTYQDRMWHYPVAVQELRQYSDKAIRDMFRRLNYVMEQLNKQELRHSQYFGEFTKTVERLAQHHYWEDFGIFTKSDYRRMKDIEFVSELFIVAIDGIQDGQKTIDSFYAKYDSKFPSRSKYIRRFDSVLDRIASIPVNINNTRLSKRADFYALFAAVNILLDVPWPEERLRSIAGELERLCTELDRSADQLQGVPLEYYNTVIEGPNKLAKRQRRTHILRCIIDRALHG